MKRAVSRFHRPLPPPPPQKKQQGDNANGFYPREYLCQVARRGGGGGGGLEAKTIPEICGEGFQGVTGKFNVISGQTI